MKNILEKVKDKNLFLRLIYFYLCLFFQTIAFNVVVFKYNAVVGGLNGIALIFNKLTNFSTIIFIDLATIILMLLCLLFLGKKKTMAHVLGALSYPIMLSITEPIANFFPDKTNNLFLIICIFAIVKGVTGGIIYRMGFSTGGFDMANDILAQKAKKSMTSMEVITSAVIMIIGGIIFSPIEILYGFSFIYLSNYVADIFLLGRSNNKMIYVLSKKNNQIEKYILNNINSGITEIKVKNKKLFHREQLLMCVVHNTKYPIFREEILKIDKDAKIISNKCYELNGGFSYKILPF